MPASHTFDFAFIDADKTSYAIYYEEILKRMRPSGLILFDNVLWSGAVVDESKQDADTLALRKLNDFIAKRHARRSRDARRRRRPHHRRARTG